MKTTIIANLVLLYVLNMDMGYLAYKQQKLFYI